MLGSLGWLGRVAFPAIPRTRLGGLGPGSWPAGKTPLRNSTLGENSPKVKRTPHIEPSGDFSRLSRAGSTIVWTVKSNSSRNDRRTPDVWIDVQRKRKKEQEGWMGRGGRVEESTDAGSTVVKIEHGNWTIRFNVAGKIHPFSFRDLSYDRPSLVLSLSLCIDRATDDNKVRATRLCNEVKCCEEERNGGTLYTRYVGVALRFRFFIRLDASV